MVKPLTGAEAAKIARAFRALLDRADLPVIPESERVILAKLDAVARGERTEDEARLDYLDRCEGAFRYPGTGEAYDYDYYFDEPARKIGKLGSARDVLDRAMKEHP